MRRLTAVGFAVVALLAGRARATDLDDRLAAVLRQPGCRSAKVGALVVDASSGEQRFASDADTPLAPASNMKVLTALAALATFGPAHQFTTVVASDRPLDASGSIGVLAVRGGGDPALTSEELWRLAADLQRRGLRRVRGGLLLDDSYFDGERWNPAWGSPSARAYHAPVAALTANYGAFSVEVAPPAAAGQPAQVSIDPPLPFFALSSAVRVGGDAPISVERESDGDRERVRVGGSVRPGAATIAVQRSVTDPVRYAAALLRLQLAALGIAVEGPDRIGPVPAGYTELVAYRGQPLRDVVALLMKWSNNNIAEMLVKDLGAHAAGAPGSWSSGVAAARAQLASLGVDLTGLTMLDGSGLAAADRVTPRTLVSALRAARASFAFGPEFAAALPIASRDGTLKKRAPGAIDRARAKTGMINGVASLSGYARSSDGHELVFSILNNDSPAGDLAAVACNDAFVEALVE